MKVLIINCGSSSIKYQVFDMSASKKLAAGLVERIGDTASRVSHKLYDSAGNSEERNEENSIADHRQGVQRIADWLMQSGVIGNESELSGIGHRIVHGGAEFHEPTRITDKVLDVVRQQSSLAPLHNPANILGIEMTMAQWPGTPQVGIFDTAFHQTLPEYAYQYALPAEFAREHRIRRYGFHGTSHKYVAQATAEFLRCPLEQLNAIILHLGNGASASAIQAGRCIDTSMGLTPLEGLMMGTRGGDIDPGVVLHLMQNLEMSAEEVSTLLNKQSGLKGVCDYNDMREVLQQAKEDNQQAELALQMYAYRIKKYIGAYSAILPQLHALVFTAGIGEHSPEIRARACDNLSHLGISLDAEKNTTKANGPRTIHDATGKVQVLVVPTDEELEMARQTMACLGS